MIRVKIRHIEINHYCSPCDVVCPNPTGLRPLGSCVFPAEAAFIVKFHWSSPLFPAFCHIMGLMAWSASTKVWWNQRSPARNRANLPHRKTKIEKKFCIFRAILWSLMLKTWKKARGKDKLSNRNLTCCLYFVFSLGYFRGLQSMREKQVHVPTAKDKQMNLDGEVSRAKAKQACFCDPGHVRGRFSPSTQWMLRCSQRRIAAAIRTFCAIHPVVHSSRIPASTKGKPVCPVCHLRKATGSEFQDCPS